MKQKLSCIQSRWRRIAISALINLLFAIQKVHPRARVHWVGYHRRVKRYERALFITIYFGALAVLDIKDFILWSIAWGGTASLFLNLYTIYRLVPRKREHWVKP